MIVKNSMNSWFWEKPLDAAVEMASVDASSMAQDTDASSTSNIRTMDVSGPSKEGTN